MKEFQALGLDLKIINDKGEACDLKQIEDEEDREGANLDIDEIELTPPTDTQKDDDSSWDDDSEFDDEEDSLDDLDDSDIDFDEGGEF